MGYNVCHQMVKVITDVTGYPGKDDAHYCVRFRGATTRNYKGQDGYYVSDPWSYVAYGQTARNVEKFFKKGSRFIITSEPRNHNSTGDDGTKYRDVEYVINGFDFVESAKPAQQQAQAPVQQQAPASGWQPQQQAPAQQQWQPQQAAPQQQQWQQQAPAQQQWQQQAPAQQAQAPAQAPGFVANWDANASGLPFN